MINWKIIAFMIALMMFTLWGIRTVTIEINEAVKSVEKKGLKRIFNDIWEGSNNND